MTAIETLISVLCGPDGKCCISGSDDDRRLIDSALAELAKAAQPAPVLWVSPEQFANFMDADEAQFGRYVPARKTSAGNFTMPLFAARAPAPAQPAAELESQLAQRFDAADMATASAQGFRDGVASLSANAGEPRNAIDRDALIDAIAQGLHGTWHCTRVWEAWHVGTMSQDDFEPVDESETPTEIADAVLALLAAAPAQAAAPIKTLEEAIAHAEDKAKGTSACAMEHAKLAAWLTELQLLRAARTAPGQADSVQEDAALWHWLAEYLVGTRTDLDDEIVACETVNDLRKLVEAAIKQGASNGR